MTAQEELDEFDKTHRYLEERHDLIVKSRVSIIQAWTLPPGMDLTPEMRQVLDVLYAELKKLQPLVFQRKTLTRAAYYESMGLPDPWSPAP